MLYTPYYCEENVYKLCEELNGRTNGELFVAFISNRQRMARFHRHFVFSTVLQRPSHLLGGFAVKEPLIVISVPFLSQDVDDGDGDLVIWDYHVILLERQAGSSLVYDLSSLLPAPCALDVYARLGLGPAESYGLDRMFRVVPALLFLQHFASDRSHMQLVDGTWSKPPPPYPAISAADGTVMNLPKYWDMGADADGGSDGRYGHVMSEDDFLAFFGARITWRRTPAAAQLRDAVGALPSPERSLAPRACLLDEG